MGPSAALTTRNRSVHLRAPVIMFVDIVRVARAVDVGIVPVVRLVFDRG